MNILDMVDEVPDASSVQSMAFAVIAWAMLLCRVYYISFKRGNKNA